MTAREQLGWWLSRSCGGATSIAFSVAPRSAATFICAVLWPRRMRDACPKAIWLNSEPEQLWPHRQSISVIREIREARMYPVTIKGPECAMRNLSK